MSESEQDALESDYRCEAHEGYEASDRCRKVATQVRREPYTPARFKVYTCDEHADSIYSLDLEATEQLRRDVEKERLAYDAG